jgi:hypothetical protein
MKLKALAVVALLVLGCSAAFAQTTYTFGFSDAEGNVSCDFVTFIVSGPYAVGTHDYTTFCGEAADGVLVGFTGNLGAHSGGPIDGPVVNFADNSEDASLGLYSGCQLAFVTRKKASLKRYGWAWYATCGGNSEFLLAWGYLSNQAGAPGAKTAFDVRSVASKIKR